MLDALVLGKGPAGLAAAGALAARGLAVAVAGPPGPVRWPARYAAWTDDLPAALRPTVLHARWPRATVATGARRTLEREYGLIDNGALADALLDGCDRHGVRWMEGEAGEATHHAHGTTVRFRDGQTQMARVVVDATGHDAALVTRPAEPRPGVQTAAGWTMEADGVPLPAGEALLMDWSRAWKDGDPAPTFLYGFALPDGTWFLEETALVRRPALGFDTLERRLRRRLEEMGVRIHRVVHDERVWIPMGGALPAAQRVVGFGAAGGMVHPATGYSVARSLSMAPRLAEAVAGALGAGRTPEQAAAAAWEALWPADARRRYALYRYGMEMLLAMDADETRAFFDAFFALPPRDWSGYLSDRLGAGELMALMGRFFAAAPPAIRTRLAGGMLAGPGRELASSMWGGLGWLGRLGGGSGNRE